MLSNQFEQIYVSDVQLVPRKYDCRYGFYGRNGTAIYGYGPPVPVP
jgi:hypothetical protein